MWFMNYDHIDFFVGSALAVDFTTGDDARAIFALQ